MGRKGLTFKPLQVPAIKALDMLVVILARDSEMVSRYLNWESIRDIETWSCEGLENLPGGFSKGDFDPEGGGQMGRIKSLGMEGEWSILVVCSRVSSSYIQAPS